MKKKKLKVFLKLIFAYVLLTTGIWMFLESYSNSYNRFTTEKIQPANININNNVAEIEILDTDYNISIENILPESKMYYFLYLMSPDELRLLTAIFS